ncbi:MAG: hypothetical protein AB7D57_08370, partial [Desulfovibrionaceae bacterium]
MEAGAFDFLLKPVGLDELWTKLRDARELRRLSGAEDGDPAPASAPAKPDAESEAKSEAGGRP